MKKQAGWVAAVGILAWGSIPSPIAHAQEGDGLSYSFSINQRLNANDNRGFDVNSPGTTITSTTGLGFSLRSETRTQRLNFNLGATVEGGYFASSDSTDFELARPNANLRYTRNSARSTFRFGAAVRRNDVSTLVLDPDLPELDEDGEIDPDATFDPDDLIVDDGTRQVTSLSTGLTTGIDSPMRLSFSARLTQVEYTDTTDPDLNDNRRLSYGVNGTFRVSPTINATASLNASRFEDENADNREVDRQSASIGFQYTISETTSVSASVSANTVEDTRMGATTTTEGAGFRFSLRNERPNGSIGLTFNRSISSNGEDDSLNLTRSFEIRDGRLSVGLGLVDGAASNASTTANATYRRALPTGSISASFRQNLSTSDDEDVLRTRVAVNYNRNINAVSSLGAGLSIANSNVLGAGSDTRRTSLNLTYNRQLAEDWALQTGYSFQRAEEEGAASRTSNSIFVGARKTFSFR